MAIDYSVLQQAIASYLPRAIPVNDAGPTQAQLQSNANDRARNLQDYASQQGQLYVQQQGVGIERQAQLTRQQQADQEGAYQQSQIALGYAQMKQEKEKHCKKCGASSSGELCSSCLKLLKLQNKQ